MIHCMVIVSKYHRFVKREITENKNYIQSLIIFGKNIDKVADIAYS